MEPQFEKRLKVSVLSAKLSEEGGHKEIKNTATDPSYLMPMKADGVRLWSSSHIYCALEPLMKMASV